MNLPILGLHWKYINPINNHYEITPQERFG